MMEKREREVGGSRDTESLGVGGNDGGCSKIQQQLEAVETIIHLTGISK